MINFDNNDVSLSDTTENYNYWMLESLEWKVVTCAGKIILYKTRRQQNHLIKGESHGMNYKIAGNRECFTNSVPARWSNITDIKSEIDNDWSTG